MFYLALTQGKVALVDEADAPLLSAFTWHAVKVSKAGDFYAASNDGSDRIYMHRLIMGAGPGEEVDHRDGDGLNNMRTNLRLTTHALNLANQRPQQGRSSRFKGVSLCKRPKFGRVCWASYIKVNGRKRSLGHFDSEEDAARAYDAAALAEWGEHARLNFEAVMV